MATTLHDDPFVAIDASGDIEINLTPSDADPFGLASPTAPTRDLLPPGRWYEVYWPSVPWRIGLYIVVAAASFITLLALAAGLATQPTCIGCDSVERVGMSRSLSTDALAVQFASCGGEAIHRVTVQSAESGAVYWQATASPPISTETIVVGQPAEAMIETVPLSDPLPPGELLAVVTTNRDHVLSFRTANILPSKVYWDGLLWSSDGFQEAVRSTGGCVDWIGPLGSSTGSALQWSILIGALGIAGIAASRLGNDDAI